MEMNVMKCKSFYLGVQQNGIERNNFVPCGCGFHRCITIFGNVELSVYLNSSKFLMGLEEDTQA